MPTVTFHGHSCVSITDGKHNLIIDPFITGNDQADIKPDDLKVDYILLTHGHGDHFGDTLAIAKANEATVIANFELANLVAGEGCKIHPMHIGGGHDFPFGRVKLTIAHHGGGYGENASRYAGPPAGLLITIGGKTIYHAGDTGLFLDMKLIGEMNSIDLAILPIGDNFTMGIDDAVKAVQFLNPKRVMPVHYNTWPIIAANPHTFAGKVSGDIVSVIDPGETIAL